MSVAYDTLKTFSARGASPSRYPEDSQERRIFSQEKTNVGSYSDASNRREKR
jgi:hypothetical protein